MYYTILFTDWNNRTAGIVIVEYEIGDTSPSIVSHAHQKGKDYCQAFLLTEKGIEHDPFYGVSHDTIKSGEVNEALERLADLVDEEHQRIFDSNEGKLITLFHKRGEAQTHYAARIMEKLWKGIAVTSIWIRPAPDKTKKAMLAPSSDWTVRDIMSKVQPTP